MSGFILRIVCCFIPSRAMRHCIRHRFRGGDQVTSSGGAVSSGNHIFRIAPDGTRYEVAKIPGCTILFKGTNNNVYLHEPIGLGLRINVSSNTNITIYPVHACGALLNIFRGEFGGDCPVNVIIHKNFSSTGGVHIELAHGGGGDVVIGEDCMFAYNITIRNGDYHTIVDSQSGQVLNHNCDVRIGNHVWVATDVLISKGAVIPDNSVVAARSVVTHQFDAPNIVIAGVPARMVKQGINWDRCCVADFIRKNK